MNNNNYLSTRSFKEVQLLFDQRFRDRVSPTKMTIRKNVKKYKTEGSSLDRNKDRSGRMRSERTLENINILQEKLIDDLRISVRKNGLNISKSTFNRITKRYLKWHPYKMHVIKERITNAVDLLKENQDLSQKCEEGHASLSSKKWQTYRRKWKLAAYIRNKNITGFRMKHRN